MVSNIWLATFVYSNTYEYPPNKTLLVHDDLCCSTDINKCIEFIKNHTSTGPFEVWKKQFIEDLDKIESQTYYFINLMRNNKSDGVNISFNGNKSYVDFKYIKYIE